MDAISSTAERVPEHTAAAYNEKIRHQTAENIRAYSGSAEAIEMRLRELDREWDIERTLQTQAASVTLIDLALGVFVDRRFLIIPGLVGGFLLQHALQGWCPPVPVFRRFGVRTETEIARERYALKALRGDFRNLETGPESSREQSVERAFQAARP